jgi:hypothetical protein
MASVPGSGVGRVLAAAACIVLLAGCGTATDTNRLVDGVGAIRTETRAVGAFDKVEVRHGLELRLVIGSPQRVSVTARENLLAMTTTIVSEGRLVVEARQDFVSGEGIIANVTTSTITELVLHDGAAGLVDGLDAVSLVVHVDHGATLTMTGSVGWLGLASHGACVIDLGRLVARNATVELAQGVVVRIGVGDSISGSASGGVALTVCGDPLIVDVRTTEGSTVNRRCDRNDG